MYKYSIISINFLEILVYCCPLSLLLLYHKHSHIYINQNNINMNKCSYRGNKTAVKQKIKWLNLHIQINDIRDERDG